MTRPRLIDAITVLTVCLLGGVVLHGIGTPIIASIAIAVLAAATTPFIRWSRGYYARTRGNEHKLGVSRVGG